MVRDLSGLACQLNWSAQHLREVYSQESESPKFFADVDLDAAHLIRVDQSVVSHRKNGVPAVASRQMFQLKVPTPSHIRHAETQLAGYEIGIDPSVNDHCGRS